MDDVATVSEDDIARALIFLMERNKLVVEPAGSVPVAALMNGKLKEEYGDLGTVVCVLSGGNIDPMLMLKVIQRGLSAAGRYMTIKMMLSDRPGELATISRIISENDANVTGVDHTRVGGSLSMAMCPSPSTWKPRVWSTAARSFLPWRTRASSRLSSTKPTLHFVACRSLVNLHAVKRKT